VSASPAGGVWVEGISRAYVVGDERVPAVADVTAHFAGGALTVISGPSGSGKSTLLRMLGILDRPDSGGMWLHGQSIAALSTRKRRSIRRLRVGYVFQQPAFNLLSYARADEHVRLGAQLRGRAPNAADDALLDLIGLASRRTYRPAQLSGGEQQRLALAFAAAGNPTVLVADEPTASLDSVAGASVIDALHLLAAQGLTVIASSHDPALVETAHAVVRLHDGRRVEG
jgi:putative ABC transport system ATP-binding protein